MTDLAWIDEALIAARPQAVGALLRYFRDLDTAEEAFQEACLRALRHWPVNGPPRDPASWLILVGRNSALDSKRRQNWHEPLPEEEKLSDLDDAESAVAEHLGGTESAFAAEMTARARRLGMTRTVFRNASGLPDPAQVTTARDMAILGQALQDDFPRSFNYFKARSFTWGGKTYATHNKLLGRVDGVNGIKTGYTNASGFNLVVSAKRGRSEVIAVVLGGNTGAARDARMIALLDEYMAPGRRGFRLFGRN